MDNNDVSFENLGEILKRGLGLGQTPAQEEPGWEYRSTMMRRPGASTRTYDGLRHDDEE